MDTVSKFFIALTAAALFLSASVISAQACEGRSGMTVWVPTSQTVADGSTPIPPAAPGTDG